MYKMWGISSSLLYLCLELGRVSTIYQKYMRALSNNLVKNKEVFS